MTTADTSAAAPDWYMSTAPACEPRPTLTFDLDVDICVVGAGLAGLHVARAAAQRGAQVVVLEAQQVAWNASSRHFGLVAPGFAVDPRELIERVGFDDARTLWGLAQAGMERVRADVADGAMPGVEPVEGWLQVSHTDAGDELIARMQVLGGDFGVDVEGWQIEQVRDAVRSDRYFHGIHYPKAISIHARNYALGLMAAAERSGVRIFENTPVTAIDTAGIRKRIDTPSARLRASQIVLAGNVHLGTTAARLAATVLPVFRHVAVTEPLHALDEVLPYRGAIGDIAQIDHYRRLPDGRLMWSSGTSSWGARPQRIAGMMKARIERLFPQLGPVAIASAWSGVYGQTVHGMPQIGALRPGVWVASGFGRQGVATTAMAGEIVASAMLEQDDRWRLFSPFELVWTGGWAGRVVGEARARWLQGEAAFSGAMSRYRERAQRREEERERRLEAANRSVREGGAPPAPHP